MVAIITGDIISSRKLINHEIWLTPLKALLSTWGNSPKNWKLDRGDFFQIEVSDIEEVLEKALAIKALLKKIKPFENEGKAINLDVRLAIGIGEKTYSSDSISESNGPAFINSGEKYDVLKKENTTLAIKSPWKDFDEEINLYLRLATIFMDKWSFSSAEVMDIVLRNPNITQYEIGQQIHIQQSAVSRRWNRANVTEVLEVNKMFQKKVKSYVHDYLG